MTTKNDQAKPMSALEWAHLFRLLRRANQQAAQAADRGFLLRDTAQAMDSEDDLLAFLSAAEFAIDVPAPSNVRDVQRELEVEAEQDRELHEELAREAGWPAGQEEVDRLNAIPIAF